MEQNSSSNRGQFIIRGMKFAHFFFSILLFFIFWMLFRYHTLFPVRDIGFRYNYFAVMAYGAILLFFNRTYNAYLLGYSRIRTMLFAQSLSQFFSIVLLYFLVSFGWKHFYDPRLFIPMFCAQLVLDLVWTYFGTELFFHFNPPRKTILIYRNEVDIRRLGSIRDTTTKRLYHIAEELRYEGDSFQDIRDRLDGYEAIFVSGVASRCRNGILKYCKETGTPGFFLPHIGDVIMQEAFHIKTFDSPVLYVARTYQKPEYAILKRGFDIIGSLFGIVFFSPLLLLTALAIRLYDGGPAIYKQVRLTKDAKKFKIYKFRSMRVDAEKDGVARLSTGEHDDRITPVGRIVRKCRLDELPQLFNILKGDMSFVGPRPERPEIAEQYYESIPDFKLRLQVKAGLTGYAQVYGKYNTDPYEKLEFDLLYMNNMGVLTDLRLIFATFGILFSPESTSGVEDGSLTAMASEALKNWPEADGESGQRPD